MFPAAKIQLPAMCLGGSARLGACPRGVGAPVGQMLPPPDLRKWAPNSLIMVLLGLLLFLPVLRACPHCGATCSSNQNLLPCFITDQPPPSPDGALPDWGRLYPFDLKVFYFIKSEPISGDVIISARIRWRLPPFNNYSSPVQGFQINVRKGNETTPTPYYATLGESVFSSSSSLRNSELFLNIDGFFEFGSTYTITVTLLPLGRGGSAKTVMHFPKWSDTMPNCERYDSSRIALASSWISVFSSIEVLQARRAVNVSFLPAPTALCIEHYRVRLESNTGTTIAVAIIKQMVPDIVMFHLFESVPIDTPLIVKVTPNSTRGRQCVCSNCNCATLKSQPFFVNKLVNVQPVLPVAPIFLVPEEKNNDRMLWTFVILLLTVTVCLLVLLTVLVLVYCRRLTEVKLQIRGTPCTEKLLENSKSEKAATVLLVNLCNSPSSHGLCNELGRLLLSKDVTVRYDKWEELEVEENIYRWIAKVLSVAEYILVVDPTTTMNPEAQRPDFVSSELQTAIRPNDKRLIHVNFEEELLNKSPFVEIVYQLPRDSKLFCKCLSVEYDEEAWLPFVEMHRERHLPSPQASQKPSSVTSTTTFVEDEENQIDPPEPGPLVVATTADVGPASPALDSAYGSMHTGEMAPQSSVNSSTDADASR